MKTKYTRSSLLFLIAYVIWITVFLIKYTYLKSLLPISMNEILFIAKSISIILLLLKFINDREYKLQNVIGFILVFFVGYIEYSVQDNTVFLFMLFIFIYSARNVDFKDILKVTLIIEVTILIITVGLSLMGVIPNQVWDVGIRHRYDLGFIYCTFSSHLMLFITMNYSCLRKRMNLLEVFILLMLNSGLYFYNDTRLDMLIVCPFLIFTYLWTHFSDTIKNGIVTKILFQYSSVIMAIIIVALQKIYTPTNFLLVNLNSLLSNRLQLGYNAIEEYGFTLFGQHIRWVGQGGIKSNPSLIYNYVDSSFLKYALNYGIVFMIILFIGLIWMGRKAIQEQNQALCVSLLFLYVFAMVDAELCVLAFHPFLLLMSGLLNPHQGEEYEKER